MTSTSTNENKLNVHELLSYPEFEDTIKKYGKNVIIPIDDIFGLELSFGIDAQSDMMSTRSTNYYSHYIKLRVSYLDIDDREVEHDANRAKILNNMLDNFDCVLTRRVGWLSTRKKTIVVLVAKKLKILKTIVSEIDTLKGLSDRTLSAEKNAKHKSKMLEESERCYTLMRNRYYEQRRATRYMYILIFILVSYIIFFS
jgi:hypothetical protein